MKQRTADLFADGHRCCCAQCGEWFDAEPSRGRPVIFCSDACRIERARKQKADWKLARAQAAVGSLCWSCTAPLPPHQGRGRINRYCSNECRRHGIQARRAALWRSRLT